MIKKVFILLIALNFNFIYSQTYKVNYKVIGDGITKNLTQQGQLVFNDSKAFYTQWLPRRKPKTTYEAGRIIEYSGSSGIIDSIYTDKKKDSIYEKCTSIDFSKEVISKVKWKLIDETKKIGEFVCKKATKKFRGRTYTAWYTTKIPTSFGPWKLHGLPGLIINLDADNGRIKFILQELKKINVKKKKLSLPKNKRTTNLDLIVKIKRKSYLKSKRNAATEGYKYRQYQKELNFYDLGRGLKITNDRCR